jgi:peptide-methionine (R)-S-oxide reductase
MKRRHFITTLAALFAAHRMAEAAAPNDPIKIEKVKLSDDEWKKRLSPQAYAVLRHESTEAPGSSPLNGEKRKGHFACAGCDLPLFTSDTKYESGTGWPSFYSFIPGRLATKTDFKMILPRTEYHCARCEGHQGHVFDDGPKPTGKRYCNNGVALKFVAA